MLHGRQYVTTAKDRAARMQARNLRVPNVDGSTPVVINIDPQSHVNGVDVPQSPVAPRGSLEDRLRDANLMPRQFVPHGDSTHLRQALSNELESDPLITRDCTGQNFGTLSTTDRTVVIELIRKLQPCSGENEAHLVHFLKQVNTIFQIVHFGHYDVMKLILPQTQALLFEIWSQGLELNHTWDTLHFSILTAFFPGLQLERVTNRFVKRLQWPQESFSSFINDVISSATALQCHFQDSYLIEVILSNMNPHMRNCFTFQDKPKTIWELKALANSVNASIQADRFYFHTFAENQRATAVPSGNQQQFAQRPPTKCFTCGELGHIARDCRQGNFRGNLARR